jgi:glycine/D-amino acid oxidase-like deaminating enzyme
MEIADMTVIGSGQGGVPLAADFAKTGKNVVLFERDALGGSCINYGHVVSSYGWGEHSPMPLSQKAATYAGVFVLLPLLTGKKRAHHDEILRQATHLAEARQLRPVVDPASSPCLRLWLSMKQWSKEQP